MEILNVEIDGNEFEIKVVRSIRRTISLEIRRDGIVLKIPRRLSDDERDRFLQKHIGWLRKKLDEKGGADIPDENGESEENDTDDRADEKSRTKENSKAVQFPVYAELTSKEKNIIKKSFEERVAYHAEIMEITYGRISVRDQKTRWGSCSSKGNLNFNYRLYYMPQPLMDYVIIHELSHRRQMNHSKKFWAEVEKYCPEYKKCVSELRRIPVN